MYVISISNFEDPKVQQSEQTNVYKKETENVPFKQTLSAEPVARIYSENGLNERQLTSAVCASTTCDGLL